jgi:hypothetical protein
MEVPRPFRGVHFSRAASWLWFVIVSLVLEIPSAVRAILRV